MNQSIGTSNLWRGNKSQPFIVNEVLVDGIENSARALEYIINLAPPNSRERIVMRLDGRC